MLCGDVPLVNIDLVRAGQGKVCYTSSVVAGDWLGYHQHYVDKQGTGYPDTKLLLKPTTRISQSLHWLIDLLNWKRIVSE
jgi:hypothetical protein